MRFLVCQSASSRLSTSESAGLHRDRLVLAVEDGLRGVERALADERHLDLGVLLGELADGGLDPLLLLGAVDERDLGRGLGGAGARRSRRCLGLKRDGRRRRRASLVLGPERARHKMTPATSTKTDDDDRAWLSCVRLRRDQVLERLFESGRSRGSFARAPRSCPPRARPSPARPWRACARPWRTAPRRVATIRDRLAYTRSTAPRDVGERGELLLAQPSPCARTAPAPPRRASAARALAAPRSRGASPSRSLRAR